MSLLKSNYLKDLPERISSHWKSVRDFVKDFFTENSKTNRDKIKLGLFLLGVWYLTPNVCTLFRDIYDRLTANSLKTIQKRYLYSAKIKTEESKSEELHSWVVVTGASDGIGKAYALLFGSLGFNVVLVARSQDKLVDVAGILESKHKVHTRIIQVDFSKVFTYEDIERKIYQEVKDLDISILVNNVGVGHFCRFEKLSYKSIYELIHVNIHSYVYVTYVLIHKLKERATKKRAAIINVSSSLGDGLVMPGFGCYPASKAFNLAFSKTLANEFENIDVLGVSAGQVATNFRCVGMPNNNEGIHKGAISPDDHVRGVLKYLGRAKVATGSAQHTLKFRLYKAIGPLLSRPMEKRIMKSVDERNAQLF
mgnify:FL=1